MHYQNVADNYPNGNRLSDSAAGVSQIINNFLVKNSKFEFTADPDGQGNVASKLDKHSRVLDLFSYRVDKKMVGFSRQKLRHGSDHDHDDAAAGVSARYYFDALGRRIAKVIHLDDHRSFSQSFGYLADQDKILLSRNGRGALTLYLDGLGIDEHLGQLGPDGVKAYATDHLGTVLNGDALGRQHATATFGESLAPTSFANGSDNHAHGTSISPTSDPALYGFAGRTLDLESGLYYNRARMYDPQTGRFMSMDPIGLAGGPNLGVYSGNNPLSDADPYGLDRVNAATCELWIDEARTRSSALQTQLSEHINKLSGWRWFLAQLGYFADPGDEAILTAIRQLRGLIQTNQRALTAPSSSTKHEERMYECEPYVPPASGSANPDSDWLWGGVTGNGIWGRGNSETTIATTAARD